MNVFERLSRVRCPACNSYFSGYDKPKEKTGLVSSEVICPNCSAVIEFDKRSRNKQVVMFVLLLLAAPVVFLLYNNNTLNDFGLMLLLLLAGALILFVSKTAKWRVIKEGVSSRHDEPKTREIHSRASGVKVGTERAGYSYSFATPEPERTRIKFDADKICRIDGQKKCCITWGDIVRVTESVLLNRITLLSRRGEKISINYEIENFQGLRDTLMQHLNEYFNAAIPTKVFQRSPLPFLVFASIACFIVGLVTVGVVGGVSIAHSLVIIPVALVFSILAMRQVRSVELTDQFILLRRFLWPPSRMNYRDIIDVEIGEKLDGFLTFPSNHRSLIQCPGIIVKTRSNGTPVLTLLTNGPMPLFVALQQRRGHW